MKKAVPIFLLCVLAGSLFADQITIWDGRQLWTKHTFLSALEPKVYGEYANGDLYIKYRVLDKPSSIKVYPMLCFWSQDNTCENCTGMGNLFTFTDEGYYYIKILGPARYNFNVIHGTKYTSDHEVDRILHQWWVDKDGRKKILRAASYDPSNSYGDGVEEHIPIDFVTTGILVKPGDTFVPPADWIKCPSGWGCNNEIIQTPYQRITRTLPGRLEVEDFDEGGEGVAYHDDTGGNYGGEYRQVVDVDIRKTADPVPDSGYKVLVAGDEWLEYTVNVTAGKYDLLLRVATPRDGGNKATVKLGNTILGSVDIPNTGSWETFQTISIPAVTVAGGTGQVLRLDLEGVGWHLNWIEMVPGGSNAIHDLQNFSYDLDSNLPVSVYRMDGTPVVAGRGGDIAFLMKNQAEGMYLVVRDYQGKKVMNRLVFTKKCYLNHWETDK